MSKLTLSIFIVLALGIGFTSGIIAKDYFWPVPPTQEVKVVQKESSSVKTSSKSASEIESCLKAKWGEAKYKLISANPNLATVEDKFAALPCYK